MVGVGLLLQYSLSRRRSYFVAAMCCCKRHLLRLQHATANNNYDQKDTYTHVVKTRSERALKLLIDKNPTLYYCTLFSEKSVKNVKFLLQFYSSSPPVALNAKSTAAAEKERKWKKCTRL